MKKFIPLLLALAIPAHAANWLLAADSGQSLANNGAKATISDADLPNNTLRVTVENAADHTLVLGRHTTNYGNDNTTARADRNGVYSGPVRDRNAVFLLCFSNCFRSAVRHLLWGCSLILLLGGSLLLLFGCSFRPLLAGRLILLFRSCLLLCDCP